MMNKKTIKEFLKPNKKKLLVFIILGIILLLIPIIPCENLLCSPGKCILERVPIFLCVPAECSWNLILLMYVSIYLFSCAVFRTKK